MHRARLLVSLLALTVLALGFLPASLGAQEPAGPTEPVVVRFYYRDQTHLNAVAGELDIWEVHPQARYAVAAVTPGQYHWLVDLGYPVQIDAEKTATLGIDAPLDPRFYYFDDYYDNSNNRYLVDFISQTAHISYTGIAELIDIGDAWMAGQPGEHHRDLWVLRISNEDPAYGDIAAKPPFYLMANIHAREVTTPEMAVRYIKYLTSGYDGLGGYGVDPDVTWLVDWNVIYIEVSQNPDGHWQNEQDTANNWRKNMNDTECGGGRYGIDLNRNHSFMWGCCGGSSGNPCSDTYRGTSRASEPETQAYQTFISTTVFQDWNGANGDDEIPPAAPDNASGVMITLHTYSDLVLWPWGHTPNQAPNGAQLRTIGRKFAYFNNYTPQQAYSLYATDGTTDDWSYGKLGVASYTFEIGPQSGSCGGFFPNYGCMEGDPGYSRDFWAENRPAFIYAHKIARTPYMTSYGPDADTLTVTPDPVPQHTPVELTAHLQDHRYGGDPTTNIAGAEYFIDQPGADGSGTAMQPQDGSWGGASETAIATVDTSGLLPGQHYILVHGLGANGQWGPFTAVFLTITPGSCQPVEILGVDTEEDGCTVTFTAELSGTAPFDYYWDFGSFGTSTETEPTVDFQLSGTYPFTLTVTNCVTGTDTYNGEVTVHCCTEPHEAAFDYQPPNPFIGQQVAFSGTASGTLPITFTWAFGDGQSGSGAHVSHAYGAGGDYTVWMTASNECGADAVSHVVSVCRPVGGADFFWTPTDPQPNEWVYFHGSVAEGTPPIAYAWDFGDGGHGSGANVSHRYTAAGLYTVVMTATNCAGDTSVASHVVNVGGVACTDVAAVELTLVTTGTIYPGMPVQFSADIAPDDATKPYNYAISVDGVPGPVQNSSADPLLFSQTFIATGTHSVEMAAWNCAMVEPVTDVVAVVVEEPTQCVSLTAVTIAGATSGPPGTYTFTTSYEPAWATPPITYLWDDGGSGASSTRLLDVGAYTLTVTATNCTSTVVLDTHLIVITPVQRWSVYLPLVWGHTP